MQGRTKAWPRDGIAMEHGAYAYEFWHKLSSDERRRSCSLQDTMATKETRRSCAIPCTRTNT
eukprot:scaffold301586_cov35-Tisochrysis_lutea.AAC.2